MPIPYTTHSNQNGYQFFYTDAGLQYYFLFRDVTSLLPILGVYDIHVFEFQFYPAPSDESSNVKNTRDERIATTITNILHKFLQIENRIILYFCDASDGKHKARQALFGRWYRNIPNSLVRIPVELTGTIEMLEYTTYGSILYASDFEQKKLVQDFLIDKAMEILAEKYGI